MFSWMVDRVLRWALPRLLRRRAPDRIPRTGAAGRAVDGYVVHFVSRDEQPAYLVDDFDPATEMLTVRGWRGDSFSSIERVRLAMLSARHIRIEHYIGLYEVDYQGRMGVLKVALHLILPVYRLEILFDKVFRFLGQAAYNRKKFRPYMRAELLQKIIELQFHGEVQRNRRWMNLQSREFSPISLMAELYSRRFFLHPGHVQEMQRMGMYFDSLVQSGELQSCGNGNYRVTPMAIQAYETNLENERRHRDNLATQNRIFWLTVCILFVSVLTMLAEFAGPSDFFKYHPLWCEDRGVGFSSGEAGLDGWCLDTRWRGFFAWSE